MQILYNIGIILLLLILLLLLLYLLYYDIGIYHFKKKEDHCINLKKRECSNDLKCQWMNDQCIIDRGYNTLKDRYLGLRDKGGKINKKIYKRALNNKISKLQYFKGDRKPSQPIPSNENYKSLANQLDIKYWDLYDKYYIN